MTSNRDNTVFEKTSFLHGVNSPFIKELYLTISEAGSDVNFQHINLLADFMTNNGVLTSINRHGLNKLDTDVLARASFEETLELFLKTSNQRLNLAIIYQEEKILNYKLLEQKITLLLNHLIKEL